jgi:NAD-dependent deacetylase
MDKTLRAIAGALRGAKSIAILTGAGVSAESGISTFRDPQDGLWARYDPMELAHIDAFHRDPELVTRWYHWRFEKCRHCVPNPGHHALAALQREVESRGGRLTLLTQNIDGLHQQAGSTDVVELHGTILRWRCTVTGQEVGMADIPFDRFPPRSPAGGLLRPNVVWFGEMLPEAALRAAWAAAGECDVFLSIGTSAVVQPAASLISLAGSRGAKTIEINREPTPISSEVEWSVMGKSGEVLPELVRMAFEAPGPS